MKKRRLFFLLLVAQTVNAGPIHWAKQHPRATKFIAEGIAAGVYAEGLHECREKSKENCQEKYGAAWAGYGSTVALDLVGLFVSEEIGGKTGWAISLGGSATMLGWGAYQWQGGLNKPKEDSSNAKKVDLSGVTFVRH